MLQVPVMDKVGQLRKTAEPESGKEYRMVFSNKGNLVKAGHRVDVMIGGWWFSSQIALIMGTNAWRLVHRVSKNRIDAKILIEEFRRQFNGSVRTRVLVS